MLMDWTPSVSLHNLLTPCSLFTDGQAHLQLEDNWVVDSSQHSGNTGVLIIMHAVNEVWMGIRALFSELQHLA